MAPTVNLDELMAYGLAQRGKPYVFGAAGPGSYDCSGLILDMYKQQGVNLPHRSEEQAKMGTAVAKNAIARGDLVFSDWGDGPNSHVGIATDSSHILVAPHKGTNVQVQPLTGSYLSHVTAVRRLDLPAAPAGGGVGGQVGTALTPPGAGGGTAGGSGGSGGLTSTWDGFLHGLQKGVQGWENVFTSPYREVAKPLQDLGSAAIEMATIGDQIMKLFLPSNFMRLCAGVGGTALIAVGLFFLARELRT